MFAYRDDDENFSERRDYFIASYRMCQKLNEEVQRDTEYKHASTIEKNQFPLGGIDLRDEEPEDGQEKVDK